MSRAGADDAALRARIAKDPEAQALVRALESAMAARTQALRRFTNDAAIAALAGAAERWMDPAYELRRRTTDELSKALCVDAAMMKRGLDNIFSVVTVEALERLIKDEAPTPSGMERAHTLPSGTQARLLGPRIVYHALAGNVPGLSIPVIVVSVLARSVAIVRDSTRQPLLTRMFLQTLGEDAPGLASMIVPVSWSAQRHDLEELAVGAASRVEAYGRDKTVGELRDRYRDRSVHTRGTRISVGVVPGVSDTDRWAAGFAEDMCMWEGRGCLSPKAVYVVGSRTRADRMAKRLGIALRRLDKIWPRRTQHLDDELARRSFIDRAEIAAAAGEGDSYETGRDASWCVHTTTNLDLSAAPGMRCIQVVPANDERSVAESLEASPVPIAAVGLAMEPHSDGYHELAASLRGAGATLICEPGSMQAPPLSWSPDGGKRLGDLLQWRAPDAS